MPDLTVYRLTFPGGLHIGARGVNLEESSVSVPSDTLFAALLDAHHRAGEDVDAWFADDPGTDVPQATLTRDCPYRITSAFPFAGDVLFFPLPIPAQAFLSNKLLKERRKEVKRIRFISEGILRKMLAGEPLDGWFFPEENNKADSQKGVALQGGALWLTVDEVAHLPRAYRLAAGKRHALRRQKVYTDEATPRVTVDRINAASTIFHAGRVTFGTECGLWFGLTGKTPPEFERALRTLSEDGLGGERSAGYGAFRYATPQALLLPDPQPGGAALLLSRYHPHGEEISALQHREAGYELVAVAGWLRSWDGAAQRRRRLWLVREGSIVYPPDKGRWGDVVDVRPDYENPAGDLPHPVWRCGLALAVGWPYQTQPSGG
ncbi:MAG: type III-A CRISPR-associated RAMP protein Csm4 [Anaerolineae bacterium]|nr:type III-A CRISPR-associated RAMP protein Csm4 [Anaerolineae bacterium]